jgi:hypothetical protein
LLSKAADESVNKQKDEIDNNSSKKDNRSDSDDAMNQKNRLVKAIATVHLSRVSLTVQGPQVSIIKTTLTKKIQMIPMMI